MLTLQSKFKKTMEYKIIIEQDPSGWFVGQCLQHPEAISEGKTIEELMRNMKEAIELLLKNNWSIIHYKTKNQLIFTSFSAISA